MSDEKRKYRYPGLRSFETSESMLFFGRDEEIQDLYSLIKNEKVVTLFGKSGLGKSSLINAGLCQFLAGKNYYAIRIRFGIDQSLSPLALFHSNIQKDSKIQGYLDEILSSHASSELDQGDSNRTPKLWELFKDLVDRDILVERSDNQQAKVIPLLIFDQFEEFFTYPADDQKVFLTQLSELCYNDAPTRILDPLIKKEISERTENDTLKSKQPTIRVLFSLRSDALYHLDIIKDFFPWTAKNRYRLGPLDTDKAKLAIQNPSQQVSEKFVVPAFCYNKTTLELITGFLGGTNNQVESSQLQIICNHIESKLEDLHRRGQTKSEVDSSIIDETNIQRIIHQYYYTQLRKLKNFGTLTRKILEEDLISSGRRASLTYDQLLAKVNPHKNLIGKMLESRLIREEYTHLGLTFEISHDTLVPAIEKAYKRRKSDEEKGKIRLEKKNSERLLQEKRRQLDLETELKKQAEIARDHAEKTSRESEQARQDAERASIDLKMALKEVDVQRKKALRSERHFKLLSSVLALSIILIAFLLFKNWLNLKERNEQVATILGFQADSQFERGRYFKAYRLWQSIETLGKPSDLKGKNFYPIGGNSIKVTTNQKYIISSFGDELYQNEDRALSNHTDYIADVWKSEQDSFQYDHLIKGVRHIELIPNSTLAIITRNDSINSKQIYDLEKRATVPITNGMLALQSYEIKSLENGKALILYKENEPPLLLDLSTGIYIKLFDLKYILEDMIPIEYSPDQTRFLLTEVIAGKDETYYSNIYFRDIGQPEPISLGSFEESWHSPDFSKIAVRNARTIEIIDLRTQAKLFVYKIPKQYPIRDFSVTLLGDYAVFNAIIDVSSLHILYDLKQMKRITSFEAGSFYESEKYLAAFYVTDSGTTVVHFNKPFKIQNLEFYYPKMLKGRRFLMYGNHYYDFLKREHRVFRNKTINIREGIATYLDGNGAEKTIIDAFTNRVIYRTKDFSGSRLQVFSKFVIIGANTNHGEIVLFRDTLKNNHVYLKSFYPELPSDEKIKYGLKK